MEQIVQSLGDTLVAAKQEQQRDIAGIGLKTVIAEVPAGPTVQGIVQKATPALTMGITAKARPSLYL